MVALLKISLFAKNSEETCGYLSNSIKTLFRKSLYLVPVTKGERLSGAIKFSDCTISITDQQGTQVFKRTQKLACFQNYPSKLDTKIQE